MIKTETLTSGLIKTYSDVKKKIVQNETGIEYDEAIDVPGRYTYREADDFVLDESDNITIYGTNEK